MDTSRNQPVNRIAPLLTGMLEDVERLGKQHMALLKEEVKEDLSRAGNAALWLGAGAASAFVGMVLLLFMAVHLLNEIPSLPLWACYGIVGAVVVVGGAALIYTGRQKLDAITPLPEQSLDEVKEDVQWVKKRL